MFCSCGVFDTLCGSLIVGPLGGDVGAGGCCGEGGFLTSEKNCDSTTLISINDNKTPLIKE